MENLKECSCQGRNPNCAKCSGFGMLRAQEESIFSQSYLRAKIKNPQSKKNKSVTKRPLKTCPYCKVQLTKVLKHIKKSHPEKILEFQNKQSTNKNSSKKAPPSRKDLVPQKKSSHKGKKYSSNDKSQKSKFSESQKKQLTKPLLSPSEKQEILGKLGFSTKKEFSGEERKTDILSVSEFLHCSSCGAKVRKDLYERHCKRNNCNNTQSVKRKKKVTKNPLQSKKVVTGRRKILRTEEPAKEAAAKSKEAPSQKESFSKIQIFLESKRGYRCDEYRTCSSCGMPTSPTWRYLADDGDNVFICMRCKPLVFERSFGKKDALDVAVQGGMFEGNRRRH